MYRKYLLVCVLFLWILVEGCHCCKSYANSGIPQGCEELHIDNGNACYEELYWGWKATFSCNTGFYLKGSDTRSCTWYWLFIRWDWDNQHTQCIREPTETTPKSSLTSTTRTRKPITSTTATSAPPTTTTTPSTAISTMSTSKATSKLTKTSTIITETVRSKTSSEGYKSAEQSDDNSLIAVYVTVPVLAVGIIVGVIFFQFLYRRRRNASTSSGSSSKDTTISPVTNKAYEKDDRGRIPAERVENNDAEYSAISDAVDQSEYNTINSNGRINHGPNRNIPMIVGPNKDDTGEYNTINAAGRIQSGPNNDNQMNMSPNYNHVVLQSDSEYDLTTNTVSMAREESDTYSHINGTVQNPRPYLINHSDNIYNGLRLNTGEFDKTAVNVQNDNPYDHTDSGLRKPANAVDDTYAHANNGFEENMEAQEYHDYFILENIEHKSKN